LCLLKFVTSLNDEFANIRTSPVYFFILVLINPKPITSPLNPFISMISPIVYLSSNKINIPATKSAIISCKASPITNPAIPNDVRILLVSIPYTDSIAVGKEEIKGYSLKMWPYNSQNKIRDTDTITVTEVDDTGIISFDLDEDIAVEAGQYYKFQLAYIAKDDSTGPYSSVAIGRCIGE
jgi:hypothetical protein